MNNLRELLSQYKDIPFIFVRPGGNWGDYLIYWGAETLADSIGLSWTSVNYEEFDLDTVSSDVGIYIHGSGGFNAWCSGKAGYAFEKALQSNARVVIQGPCTYDNDSEYTKKYFENLKLDLENKKAYLFAREFCTLELLKKYAPASISIGIDDDTAFHVDRDAFFHRAGIKKDSYRLCVLREDNEGPLKTEQMCSNVVLDPGIYASSFDHWLRLHAAAKSISTDRTHSGIAGAVLGIPTIIYGGAYHKNRSIWEYSLKKRGVLWGVPSRVNKHVIALKLKFEASWKVRKFKRWFYQVPTS